MLGAIVPTRSSHPISSAAHRVALWMACIGVSPNRTYRDRFRAFQPCGAMPESVPFAMRTPAFTHFVNPSRWASFVRRVFPSTSSV